MQRNYQPSLWQSQYAHCSGLPVVQSTCRASGHGARRLSAGCLGSPSSSTTSSPSNGLEGVLGPGGAGETWLVCRRGGRGSVAGTRISALWKNRGSCRFAPGAGGTRSALRPAGKLSWLIGTGREAVKLCKQPSTDKREDTSSVLDAGNFVADFT